MTKRKQKVDLSQSKKGSTVPPLSPKSPPAAARITTALIANSLGVHARTVEGWVSKGCPKTTLDEVIQWRAGNMRADRQPMDQRAAAPGGEAPGHTLQEKRLLADTAKIEAEVSLKNLRLQERMQNLVSRSAVLREVSELVVRVKERILAAPDEFETRFPAEVRAQCKADFEEFVRQLLWELSTWEILGESTDDLVIAAAESIKAQRERDAARVLPAAKPDEESDEQPPEPVERPA